MRSLHAVLLTAGLALVDSHAFCKDGVDAPYPNTPTLPFCGNALKMNSQDMDGVCCSIADDIARKAEFNRLLATAPGLSYQCQQELTKLICGDCHPWNLHLFETDNELTVCQPQCDSFISACGSQLTLDDLAAAGTPTRCANDYYCYPFTPYKPGGQTFPGMTLRWAGLVAEAEKAQESFLPQQLIDMRPQPDARIWWIASKAGRVYTMPDAIKSRSELVMVLDLSERITQARSNEHGLLGMALSPSFATDHFLFLYYLDMTRVMPNSPSYGTFTWQETAVLSRFTVGANNVVNKASELMLLEMGALCCSHKAGALEFHNRMLYLSLGDGGNSMWAQDRTTWWGKVLRIDPFTPDETRGTTYSIPASNPYKGNADGFRPEIFAYGLRNPFRCAFSPDDLTVDGRWFCGVVGEGAVESVVEIKSGANYGWPAVEGSFRCHDIRFPCNGSYEKPLLKYCHEGMTVAGVCDARTDVIQGNSAIGGRFYTGTAATKVLVNNHGTVGPVLNQGDYVFTDWNQKRIIRMAKVGTSWVPSLLYNIGVDAPMAALTIQDWDGEIYFVAWFAETVYNVPNVDASHDNGAVSPSPAVTSKPTAKPVAGMPTSKPTVETSAPTTSNKTAAPTVTERTVAPTIRGTTAAPTGKTVAPTPAKPTAPTSQPVGACLDQFAKCGGKLADGTPWESCCKAGLVCEFKSPFYSQCVAGSGGEPTAAPQPAPAPTPVFNPTAKPVAPVGNPSPKPVATPTGKPVVPSTDKPVTTGGCVALYGQCGGLNNGFDTTLPVKPRCCVAGAKCVSVSQDWFWQCLPL